jgi:hypothetical protein
MVIIDMLDKLGLVGLFLPLGRKAPGKKRYLSFFEEMSMSVNS